MFVYVEICCHCFKADYIPGVFVHHHSLLSSLPHQSSQMSPLPSRGEAAFICRPWGSNQWIATMFMHLWMWISEKKERNLAWGFINEWETKPNTGHIPASLVIKVSLKPSKYSYLSTKLSLFIRRNFQISAPPPHTHTHIQVPFIMLPQKLKPLIYSALSAEQSSAFKMCSQSWNLCIIKVSFKHPLSVPREKSFKNKTKTT